MITRHEALDIHEEMRRKCPELGCAETYWLSEEMAELIAHAASSMPDETFLPGDIPGKAGVVLFEAPRNERPHEAVYPKLSAAPSFLGESPVTPAYTSSECGFSWFADESGCLVRAWTRPGLGNVSVRVPFGQRWTLQTGISDPDQVLELLKWRNGQGPEPHLKTSGPKEFRDSFMAFPKAFWSIIEERLVVTSKGKAERHSRKRLARSGSPLAEREVRFVTLRRVDHKGQHGEREVEWSHRWIVDGHWRNQWHPSRKAHRQKYIMAHIKGPNDKPLVLKDVVNLVVR